MQRHNLSQYVVRRIILMQLLVDFLLSADVLVGGGLAWR